MSSTGSTFSVAHKQPAPPLAAPVLPQPVPQPAVIPAGTKAIPPNFSVLQPQTAMSAQFSAFILKPTRVHDNLGEFAKSARVTLPSERANELIKTWTSMSLSEIKELGGKFAGLTTLKGVQCLRWIANRFEQMEKVVMATESEKWDDYKYDKQWMEQNGVFKGMDELEGMLRELSEGQHVRAIDGDGVMSEAWNAVDNVCKMR